MQVEKATTERQVTTTVAEEVFTIELSRDEACALHAILSSITGHRDSENVREAVANPLWHALEDAGIRWHLPEVSKYSKHLKPMSVREN